MFVENAPILPTNDMGASIEFWRGFGLMLVFCDADDPAASQHATLSNGGLSVHLASQDGDAPAKGHGMRVLIADKAALLDLYDRVKPNAEISRQLDERSWARLSFGFVSPEGAEIYCYIDK